MAISGLVQQLTEFPNVTLSIKVTDDDEQLKEIAMVLWSHIIFS
jgi:hypothetical protein